MRIGVRAHDYGRLPAGELASRIAQAGFDSVQLAPTKALAGVERFEEVTDSVLDDAREAFQRAGVRIDVMGCYQEIGARDDGQRRLAVDRFCAGMAHAKRLGAPLVATETTHFEGSGAEREIAFAGLLDGVKRMALEAERNEVTACVEPVASHTLNSARLARRLLDAVGSRALRIVFDPVNMLTEHNIADQDAIWDEYLELLGPDIAAVHLKDVDAQMQWRNLGCGVVHYDRIFSKLMALGRELPLLREVAQPDSAAKDIAAVRRWLSR